ncbi:hypothetical protein IC801_14935 [Geobacillus sp. 44B]|uniref:hypothetical protein n=1 Tax=Saccharococcus caldoxylosilyticus TaxID=81408 RepID=UPI00036AE830|nr:hypothetical protein [Parageobacillus caldoxylosilyticus]OQP00909.1 hypothetical protein BSK33_13030 [Geobacillus sp. 44B]QNU37101.1 hypothetical protein IC801_14935 [Geobacillus sp. 44B]BDG35944.1 hypothetical protein PcaKH15_18500 [Parageobacillus caldoxylosilyticus]BDG39726.1 hypothetical protein PcaKH16_18650 [Parageobacillus caldoxylosilyticus]BDG43496.1 hypothetical protein PcaKH35_18410 [Parageobacillus caldoxylosilyticus]
MKQLVLALLLFGSAVFSPVQTKAASSISIPCSLVLKPVDSSYPNAMGVALVYKVKLITGSPRTSISIHALHLPKPSSFGDYDRFEGFAFIPNVISWRFPLYPTPETDDPTWAGRLDSITAGLEDVQIQVRLSNTKTGKLGPVILTNSINYCK